MTSQELASWQNFYVIVGSSAGALTGLQFVVIALMMQVQAASSMSEIRAFGTPTVMHFCSALVVSSIMTAPFQGGPSLALCLAVVGLLGACYSLRAILHARKTAYKPDLEDWVWYLALPLLAHVALLGSAAPMFREIGWSLPAIAADSLFFILLGVHNSWDTVTYIAIKHSRQPGSQVEPKSR